MKRGQIWVETVIYTLIAFIMIGLVLAYAKPKIEQSQDKAIIEQSISMMEDINLVILSLVQGGAGNKRLIELGVKKGVLNINGINDSVVFELETKHIFSQPGEDVNYGSMVIHTKEMGNSNLVTLTLDYDNYNVTFDGKDELITIPEASTPYQVFISNRGKKKIVGGICSSDDDCSKEGFTSSCTAGNCSYVAEKINILFEFEQNN